MSLIRFLAKIFTPSHTHKCKGEEKAKRSLKMEILEGREMLSSSPLQSTLLTDDRYENNNSYAWVGSQIAGTLHSPNLGTLTSEKVLDNLVMADSEDWFRFEMKVGGTSSNFVKTEFLHTQGDVDMRLYKADGTTLVGSSTSVSNSETISLNGLAAGTYFVKVYGYLGKTNPKYKLTINPGVASSVAPVIVSHETVGTTQIDLQMDAYTDSSGIAAGAKSFKVFAYSDATCTRVVSTATTTNLATQTVELSGLSQSTTYYIQSVVINNAGTEISKRSNSLQVKTENVENLVLEAIDDTVVSTHPEKWTGSANPYEQAYSVSSGTVLEVGDYVPNIWVVMLTDEAIGTYPSVVDAANYLKRFNITQVQGLGMDGMLSIYVPGETVEEQEQLLATISILDDYQPDMIIDAPLGLITDIINDAYASELWGLNNINVASAWGYTQGSSEIVIAVLDSGIDYLHPDLAANIWRNSGEIPGDGIDNDGNGYIDDYYGWNSVDVHSSDPRDDHGHGTHVAGTIGALANSIGVVGIAPNVKILPIKVFSADGRTTIGAVASGINYATAMKNRGVNIKAINASIGGGGYDSMDHKAIEKAGKAGILFIAAAGNKRKEDSESSRNNDLYPHYPSDYELDNIISVAAINSANELAYFSHYGATSVDLAAPGVDVLSTYAWGRYSTASGTSMAAPHVAGVVALAFSLNPNLEPLQVKNAILNGSVKNTYLVGNTLSGGQLNAANTLQILKAQGTIILAPESLKANVLRPTSVDLKWNDMSIIESGYEIQYSRNGKDWKSYGNTLSANKVSVRVSGLKSNTTYYFRIRAINASTSSEWSNVLKLKTSSTDPAPTNLKSSNTKYNATTISWNASQNAVSYSIQMRPAAGGDWKTIGSVSGTSFTYSKLQPLQKYTFRVVAINTSKGVSVVSKSISTKTLAIPAPQLTVATVNGTTKLSWTKVEGATSYTVCRSLYTSKHWESIGSTSGTSLQVNADGTKYYYRVYANTNVGRSPSSPPKFADNSTPALPAPTNIRFVDVWDTKVDLACDAVASATSYQFFQKSGNDWVRIPDSRLEFVSPNRARISGLRGDTAYSFAIRAVSSTGTSDYSRAINVTTGPVVPSGLAISNIRGTCLDLKWNNNSSTATSFVVEYRTATGSWSSITLAANTTSYRLEGLTPNAKYELRMRSLRNDGSRSGWSESAFSTMGPIAPTMVSLTYNASNQRLTYTWKDKSANETKFLLEWSNDGGKTWNKKEYNPNTTTGYITVTTKGILWVRARAYNGSIVSDASGYLAYTVK